MRLIACRFGIGSVAALAVVVATGVAMASHVSLWHSDILRFKLAVLVLVAVLLAMHVLTPTSRAVSYGVAAASLLSYSPTADASPGKAAGELVRAADGDSRCTKGRASMLTHRGPESSPR